MHFLLSGMAARRGFELRTVPPRPGESWVRDEDFLAALEFGMPESAGIALGFDRLSMLCTGAQEIEDILWAPVAGIEE